MFASEWQPAWEDIFGGYSEQSKRKLDELEDRINEEIEEIMAPLMKEVYDPKLEIEMEDEHELDRLEKEMIVDDKEWLGDKVIDGIDWGWNEEDVKNLIVEVRRE